MKIILFYQVTFLFICLFYTYMKKAELKPVYDFLRRVLKENNKKRISNEDIVLSMSKYAPIGGVFLDSTSKYLGTESVVLGYKKSYLICMDKDLYIDSCKTLNFSDDNIHYRYYDDFLEYNKQPLEKLDGFDEVEYMKYKLFSKELSKIPTAVDEIWLNRNVIGMTRLNLFVSYKVFTLNLWLFLAALFLLAWIL